MNDNIYLVDYPATKRKLNDEGPEWWALEAEIMKENAPVVRKHVPTGKRGRRTSLDFL